MTLALTFIAIRLQKERSLLHERHSFPSLRHKAFGDTTAVNDVSLDIEEGEFLALLAVARPPCCAWCLALKHRYRARS